MRGVKRGISELAYDGLFHESREFGDSMRAEQMVRECWPPQQRDEQTRLAKHIMPIRHNRTHWSRREEDTPQLQQRGRHASGHLSSAVVPPCPIQKQFAQGRARKGERGRVRRLLPSMRGSTWEREEENRGKKAKAAARSESDAAWRTRSGSFSSQKVLLDVSVAVVVTPEKAGRTLRGLASCNGCRGRRADVGEAGRGGVEDAAGAPDETNAKGTREAMIYGGRIERKPHTISKLQRGWEMNGTGAVLKTRKREEALALGRGGQYDACIPGKCNPVVCVIEDSIFVRHGQSEHCDLRLLEADLLELRLEGLFVGHFKLTALQSTSPMFKHEPPLRRCFYRDAVDNYHCAALKQSLDLLHSSFIQVIISIIAEIGDTTALSQHLLRRPDAKIPLHVLHFQRRPGPRKAEALAKSPESTTPNSPQRKTGSYLPACYRRPFTVPQRSDTDSDAAILSLEQHNLPSIR
ncbi:hypothetical protein R3P38DRAFT_2815544 [Favolaschia claudopus]|uniref:Uncharacterized protein n=1 Tax=Favolaschia claudopus TaxID=2862362 RepID=A0AAV9Z135_9AGAR